MGKWIEEIGPDEVASLAAENQVKLEPKLVNFLEQFADLIDKSGRTRREHSRRAAAAIKALNHVNEVVRTEVARLRRELFGTSREVERNFFCEKNVETGLPVIFLSLKGLPQMIIHVNLSYGGRQKGAMFGFRAHEYCLGRLTGVVGQAANYVSAKCREMNWEVSISEVIRLWVAKAKRIRPEERKGCAKAHLRNINGRRERLKRKRWESLTKDEQFVWGDGDARGAEALVRTDKKVRVDKGTETGTDVKQQIVDTEATEADETPVEGKHEKKGVESSNGDMDTVKKTGNENNGDHKERPSVIRVIIEHAVIEAKVEGGSANEVETDNNKKNSTLKACDKQAGEVLGEGDALKNRVSEDAHENKVAQNSNEGDGNANVEMGLDMEDIRFEGAALHENAETKRASEESVNAQEADDKAIPKDARFVAALSAVQIKSTDGPGSQLITDFKPTVTEADDGLEMFSFGVGAEGEAETTEKAERNAEGGVQETSIAKS